MFSVIFELQPHRGQWDAYLGSVSLLRPELEQVNGFVGNVRYRSLTRTECSIGAKRRSTTRNDKSEYASKRGTMYLDRHTAPRNAGPLLDGFGSMRVRHGGGRGLLQA